MQDTPAKPPHASTRTTGNDSLEGVDPGGTRPTRPGQPDKSAPKAPAPKTEPHVTTANRNDLPASPIPPNKPD